MERSVERMKTARHANNPYNTRIAILAKTRLNAYIILPKCIKIYKHSQASTIRINNFALGLYSLDDTPSYTSIMSISNAFVVIWHNSYKLQCKSTFTIASPFHLFTAQTIQCTRRTIKKRLLYNFSLPLRRSTGIIRI